MAVCDYAGYDYKKKFWDDVDRRYEDSCERLTLTEIFKEQGIKSASVLDLGCGFGRLFESYEPFGAQFTLLDYADNMLAQAKERLGHHTSITFVQGDALAIPLPDASADLIVSIRTLHHLPNYSQFISELYRVVTPGGTVVFEIPNFRHILNIVRFIVGKQKNPFAKTVTPISAGFVNFHPSLIYDAVAKQGFHLIEKRNVSFFRSAFLKKHCNPTRLAEWDLRFQSLLSWTDLTPSIYMVCHKPKS
jgi:ubiquinone/menaquinone biosynthesis C-methylase UbiE